MDDEWLCGPWATGTGTGTRAGLGGSLGASGVGVGVGVRVGVRGGANPSLVLIDKLDNVIASCMSNNKLPTQSLGSK